MAFSSFGSFDLSVFSSALATTLNTSSTNRTFNLLQGVADGAVQRAIDEARANAGTSSSAPPEDEVDFSARFKELLADANAGRIRSAQRDVDKQNKRLKNIGQIGLDSQTLLRERGKIRLDLIKAELRLSDLQDTDVKRANALNRQADQLRIAIDEYKRGTAPTFEQQLGGATLPPRTADDDVFLQKAGKFLRDIQGQIRQEKAVANGISDFNDRIKNFTPLNTASQSITKTQALFKELETVINGKPGPVNIMV